MSEQKLKIGITQGDTNGIGWEVILKTFADPRMAELCTPIIYGSPQAAGFYRNTLAETENVPFHTVQSAAEARRGKVNLVPAGGEELAIEPGKATPAAGQAAVDALKKAVEELKAGRIDALVTAPVNKETVHGEEFPYTGHTEFLAAELEGEPLMMMCSERLRVGLVTIHLPVAEISAAVTEEKIGKRLHQLRELLKQDFGIVEPRIAVLALNPHAGDGGLLGREEQEIIAPAIRKAWEQGVLAYGPFPADGLFASGNYARYDAVLAMYHDQGLAPFKALAMESGINFTAGLPIVRTSPDHGTGYDIAGRGEASPESLRNAIYAAIDIHRNCAVYDEAHRSPLRRQYYEKGADNVKLDLTGE